MTNPPLEPVTPAERTPAEIRLAEARHRFGRLMKLMFGVSLIVLVGAFAWLHATDTPMPLPFLGAIAVAVIGSLMLAAALMGLVFFSAASGADDSVDKLEP
jgi:type III secretory pathway component EscU